MLMPHNLNLPKVSVDGVEIPLTALSIDIRVDEAVSLYAEGYASNHLDFDELIMSAGRIGLEITAKDGRTILFKGEIEE